MLDQLELQLSELKEDEAQAEAAVQVDKLPGSTPSLVLDYSGAVRAAGVSVSGSRKLYSSASSSPRRTRAPRQRMCTGAIGGSSIFVLDIF
jgi:hypothetical protein